MPPIAVTRAIAIDSDELVETFTRASGPGGQHVNTTDTAVQLRFNVQGSPSLPHAVKRRLAALAGARLTRDGVLVLRADGERSQEANRRAARARLVELIREAAVVPKRRRATAPGKAARARRMEAKERRGAVKRMRAPVRD